MKESRYEVGMEKLREVDGCGGEAVIASLEGIAPDLGAYIIKFAFGDIYSRQGLSLQERELPTAASLLTAGGCEPQLRVHIHGALNVGVPPEKLVEAMIHCVPYVGFPRVLNAMFAAKEVFAQRGIRPAGGGAAGPEGQMGKEGEKIS